MSSDSDRSSDHSDREWDDDDERDAHHDKHTAAAAAAAAHTHKLAAAAHSEDDDEDEDEPALRSDAQSDDAADGEAELDAQPLPALPDLAFRPAFAGSSLGAALPSAPVNPFPSAASLSKAVGWWARELLFAAEGTDPAAAADSKAARRKLAEEERQAKRQRMAQQSTAAEDAAAADAAVADESDSDSADGVPRLSAAAALSVSLPAVASYALHATIGFESDVSLSDDDSAAGGGRRPAVSSKDITLIDGALRPPPLIPRAHTNRVSIERRLPSLDAESMAASLFHLHQLQSAQLNVESQLQSHLTQVQAQVAAASAADRKPRPESAAHADAASVASSSAASHRPSAAAAAAAGASAAPVAPHVLAASAARHMSDLRAQLEAAERQHRAQVKASYNARYKHRVKRSGAAAAAAGAANSGAAPQRSAATAAESTRAAAARPPADSASDSGLDFMGASD